MSVLKGINPDSKPMVNAAIAMLATMAGVSFLMSFNGLPSIATWAAVADWLKWSVPVIVDVAITAFTLAILIFRARGESTFTAWVLLLTFTSISAAGNAAHAIDGGSLAHWQTWIGAGIAALAPLTQFFTTHIVARIVVSKPGEAIEPVLVEAEPVEAEVEEAAAAVEAMRKAEEKINETILNLYADGDGMSQRAIALKLNIDKNKVQRTIAKAKQTDTDDINDLTLEEAAA